jgi:nucleoside-diphosphate-sugar epimerase
LKILITGSESFVGKELVSQLKGKNEIVGFDMVSSKSNEYEFHQVDIRNSNLEEIIPENIDVLIHLAALSRDPDCKGKSYECFDINVMGTLNLIKAATKKNVKQFIFASSEWVYNEFKEGEIKDESSQIDVSKHTSEYALSKLVSESNLRQISQQDFKNITILRFGIIYGPRPNSMSAVESIFNNIKTKDEIQVGSLKNGRRFVHITDIAKGISKAIGLKGFNIINLTSENIITLGEIIEKGQKILNKTIKVIETNPENINIRNPSNEKAKQILDWTAEIDIESGLRTL